MKKLVSLLAALCLMGTVGLAAADSTVELDKTVTSGSTTVSLNVDSSADSYTFSIPASVTIDPVTQKGEGTLTLKSGWTLVSVNGIKLNISAVANGVTKSSTTTGVYYFTLKNDSDSAEYSIHATCPNSSTNWTLLPLTVTPASTQMYYNSTLISAVKGGDNTKDLVCTLAFKVNTMPAAGVYTDTITFAITTY